MSCFHLAYLHALSVLKCTGVTGSSGLPAGVSCTYLLLGRLRCATTDCDLPPRTLVKIQSYAADVCRPARQGTPPRACMVAFEDSVGERPFLPQASADATAAHAVRRRQNRMQRFASSSVAVDVDAQRRSLFRRFELHSACWPDFLFAVFHGITQQARDADSTRSDNMNIIS